MYMYIYVRIPNHVSDNNSSRRFSAVGDGEVGREEREKMAVRERSPHTHKKKNSRLAKQNVTMRWLEAPKTIELFFFLLLLLVLFLALS